MAKVIENEDGVQSITVTVTYELDWDTVDYYAKNPQLCGEGHAEEYDPRVKFDLDKMTDAQIATWLRNLYGMGNGEPNPGCITQMDFAVDRVGEVKSGSQYIVE